MNEQTLNRITKEAEEKYRLFRINFEILEFGDEHPGYNKEYAKLEYNVKQESKIEGYIAGATPYAERAEKLKKCLEELKIIIDAPYPEYYFEEIRNKINSALNQSK